MNLHHLLFWSCLSATVVAAIVRALHPATFSVYAVSVLLLVTCVAGIFMVRNTSDE